MLKILVFLVFLLPHLYSIEPGILAKKMRQPPPTWVVDQIQKDLKRFQNIGIYEAHLDATLKKFADDPLTLRCKMVNRRIYLSYHDTTLPITSHERLRSVIHTLKFLNKHYVLPPLDFIISLQDTIAHDDQQPPLPAPILTFAKNQSSNSLIAFPDFEILRGYSHLIQNVLEANARYPFKEKIKIAFWRGATTGGLYSLEHWKEFPRSKLVLFSQRHPDLLDARFTHITQTLQHEHLEDLLKKQDLLCPSVSIPSHIPYKYLVDIDGNTCTYSRLVWILFSNSLCLKQTSHNEQWYYSGLKPYEHYVPFKSDMSDFEEQVIWAESHPAEVEQIIHNANLFAKNNLTQEDAFYYVYQLLLAYAKLQRFTPTIHSKPMQ